MTCNVQRWAHPVSNPHLPHVTSQARPSAAATPAARCAARLLAPSVIVPCGTRAPGRRPPHPHVPPQPAPIAATSGALLAGFRTVSSTDRMRQAASVADWMALILTSAGFHTNESNVLQTPPLLTSAPKFCCMLCCEVGVVRARRHERCRFYGLQRCYRIACTPERQCSCRIQRKLGVDQALLQARAQRRQWPCMPATSGLRATRPGWRRRDAAADTLARTLPLPSCNACSCRSLLCTSVASRPWGPGEGGGETRRE
jgi:hypothetical protein